MPRSVHRERHRVSRIGWLRAAVLGANDGIVSTASLIVGVGAPPQAARRAEPVAPLPIATHGRGDDGARRGPMNIDDELRDGAQVGLVYGKISGTCHAFPELRRPRTER